ncbi:MAG: ATP-binding cassette domain-containing protein [Oscillospiraceae bacterium]
MLELSHIKKTYTVGDIETQALKDISLAFRKKEFVAILGASGSGKTTCLNIIGGLDRYDSGDLIIKGRSTKKFGDRDWDAYRNNSIGFVFQSYNLITHLSVVANVELGMTLSGVSKEEKHKKALAMLERVGLKDHLHKKPNQLSGGQMQRVAIARALVNDPEILLCDEPTGALDTETSIQILDLIRQVAADKLVIMVTHNPELAELYADRIISFSDGSVISDSAPYTPEKEAEKFSLTKTGMSFFTALGLSFNNLRTKLGRTFLTCFASSIGIIGIAVILSLSTGFQTQIDKYQSDALSEFPIMISKNAVQMDVETMNETRQEMQSMMTGVKEFADTDHAVLFDSSKSQVMHENKLTDDYLEYISKIDPAACKGIGVTRIVGMNLLRKTEDGVIPVSMPTGMTGNMTPGNVTAMSAAGMTAYPENLDTSLPGFIEENYSLLEGAYPKEPTDLVLLVDAQNRVDQKIMKDMGFKADAFDNIKFSDIVGTEIALVSNDDFYQKSDYGNFMPGTDFEKMYNADDTLTLKICGVVRQKPDVKVSLLGCSFIYSDALARMVVDRSVNSEIVEAQRNSQLNVMSMEAMDGDTKAQMISYLGGEVAPAMLMLYPTNFESKDVIVDYLDEYNRNAPTDEDLVVYSDLAKTMTDMTSGIMDAITIVLIAFAGISLVVSLIMICIITYTSVLERTKEIGILKALGARKKDITRVFDAETFILGIFSGTLGVIIAWLLTLPINSFLLRLTDLSNVATLQPLHAVLLVVISTVLTMLGGHIPARMASRKDAVEALRSAD